MKTGKKTKGRKVGKPSAEVSFMRAVAKEIIMMKFEDGGTIIKKKRKFYSIMRKYGIKRGTKKGNAISTNNFEWTLCEDLFLERMKESIGFEMSLMFNKTPNDLRHY